MRTDEKDALILSLLRQNARLSNVELARKVGLTEGAIRRRIENLVKSKTITRFTIETRGGASFGVVMVKATKETKQMMEEIRSLSIAKDGYEISGDYDACVILEGANIEEIDAKIDRIRQLKSVADTKTFVSFRRL